MTERERLIELINNGFFTKPVYEALCTNKRKACDFLADYLLENGVIVSSVKVEERRIDDLGRVLIPKNVRLSLGINYGDVISISVSDESIILRKEREENA